MLEEILLKCFPDAREEIHSYVPPRIVLAVHLATNPNILPDILKVDSKMH